MERVQNPKYAPLGVQLMKLVKEVSSPVVHAYFKPISVQQGDILVTLPVDHPFFASNKGDFQSKFESVCRITLSFLSTNCPDMSY